MEIDWRAQLHAETYQGRKQRIRLADAFVQYKLSKQGIASYRNLVAHETVLRRLMPMRRYLDELTAHDMERFKRDRVAEGVGGESIKYGLLLIRGTLKFAQQLGYQVPVLTYPQVKLPKNALRYLNADEERRLLIALNPMRQGAGLSPVAERTVELQQSLQDAYDLVVMLLDTGARYGEIANIEWSRIDLESRVIHLWRKKVQNETVLYMTDRVFSVLSRRAACGATRYIFSNRNGEARGYSAMSIRKAMRRAGLNDCRIHTLRHTHASRLIQNGMSVYEVREILGHSDIKTTMRYAHLERHQVTAKARDVMNLLNKVSVEVEG